MTCPSVQDDLKAYADAELPPLRRLAVRRHLSGCAACREEIQTMKALQQELRAGGGQDSLDPDLRARILNEVADNGSPAPTSSATPRRPWITGPPLAWGAAAIVLLGWFVLFPIFHKVHDEAPTAAQTAVAAVPAPPEAFAQKSAQTPLRSPQIAPDEDTAQAPLAAAAPMPEAKSLPVAPGMAESDAAETALRRVHKEAAITVAVANPEVQSDAVAQMVQSSGGYIAGNTLSTSAAGLKSAQMTLKVPEPQFETILSRIAKLGDVRAKNITGEDITGQVSDATQAESVLESEVHQSQARLNKLGTRAGWQDDTQARDLRVQLAQSRARLQLLQKMAALSTLTVTLDEKAKPVPTASSGFVHQLTGTTHDALGSLAASAGALLALLIWAVAYAPLWVPAVLITRHFLRLSQQRKASHHP